MNDINGIMERAEERHKQLARLIEKMLDKSEVILQAGQPHEQTNEEWLRQASTEELADVLTEIACESYYDGLDEKLPLKHNCKHFMKWLKEKHHAN